MIMVGGLGICVSSTIALAPGYGDLPSSFHITEGGVAAKLEAQEEARWSSQPKLLCAP